MKSCYLWLQCEAGKGVEGPGYLLLVLRQSHCAGAVNENAAFLQQPDSLQPHGTISGFKCLVHEHTKTFY